MVARPMASLTELFYTRINTKVEKRVGIVVDASVSAIEISEMPHSFSWERKRRVVDHELKIRMQGVDRPFADLKRLQDKGTKVNWRIKSDSVSWNFFGSIHLVDEGFVDGIFESNYIIRGFKIIKVENYGVTSRKRKYNNKNIRPLRRKKSSVATKNAPGSKRNRARVRKADLVQLPVGVKKRVRGKNVAPVRDRKLGRK